MFVRQFIRDLEQRRQLLLVQSGLRRATIEVHVATASDSLRWLDAGVRIGRRAGPWLMALAPLAGFLAARKTLGFWSMVGRSLPLVRAALTLFRR
ncbi:MAG: hypothetical protein MUE50_23005 [Pirellulaceae bacterium]|nr:hypothetical protein [Pirellulaceae bacterium]